MRDPSHKLNFIPAPLAQPIELAGNPSLAPAACIRQHQIEHAPSGGNGNASYTTQNSKHDFISAGRFARRPADIKNSND